jgi:hypothetical protein
MPGSRNLEGSVQKAILGAMIRLAHIFVSLALFEGYFN